MVWITYCTKYSKYDDWFCFLCFKFFIFLLRATPNFGLNLPSFASALGHTENSIIGVYTMDMIVMRALFEQGTS